MASTFAKVPVEVCADKRLTLQQVRVLIALLSFRSNGDVVFPSRQQIAERTGMPLCKISEATSGLVRLGWLHKEGKGGFSKATRYRVTIPETVTGQVTVTEPETVTDPVRGSGYRTGKGHGGYRSGKGQRTDHRTDQKNRPPLTGYTPEFEQAWSEYPKRAGGNNKRDAFKAWSARCSDGVTADELLEGLRRYAAFVRSDGREGTQYVKQAATFFGPSEHFREEWALPPPTGQPKRKDEQRNEFWRELYGESDGRSSNTERVINGEAQRVD